MRRGVQPANGNIGPEIPVQETIAATYIDAFC